MPDSLHVGTSLKIGWRVAWPLRAVLHHVRRAGELSFNGLHAERRLVAIQLRILLPHDRVFYRTIFAQDRNGCVRRILGKAVVALPPFCDHVSGGLMTRRPDWAIGKYDRARRYTGQD